MVLITGKPYEVDMLYMRLDTPDKDVVNIPFCEVFDGVKNTKYNRERTLLLSQQKGEYTVCFTADKDDEKNKSFELAAPQLATVLQSTIYNDKQKILKLAIQPEGELLVAEVQQLTEL